MANTKYNYRFNSRKDYECVNNFVDKILENLEPKISEFCQEIVSEIRNTDLPIEGMKKEKSDVILKQFEFYNTPLEAEVLKHHIMRELFRSVLGFILRHEKENFKRADISYYRTVLKDSEETERLLQSNGYLK